MVENLYPELAPRLTGMLLQLGEIECRACLDDENKLVDRLGEALEILDADRSDQPIGKPVVVDTGEKRIDPEDGNAKTFQQVRAQYKGLYSASEIDEYWQSCKSVRIGDASQSRSDCINGVDAKTKPKGQPGVMSKSPSSPAKAPAAPKAKSAPVKEIVVQEPVKGLSAWLNELGLDSYFKAAADWVEEQGAVTLEELVENLEDFVEDLKFSEPERKRLEERAEDAIAIAKAAPTSVVKESSVCPEQGEEPAEKLQHGGENDYRQLDRKEEETPAKRWPKSAPSQDAPAAKSATQTKQEFPTAPSKGKGKNSVAPKEQRIDPADGMARTLSELHDLYVGQYSPQEIEEYWLDCRPLGNPVLASSAPSAAASAGRSGFGSTAPAPHPAMTSSPVVPQDQAPKAKAGGYWGSGAKRRF